MAIQIPNAGTGNGQTGDNEYVLWQKTINNFSDITNAASRLVGKLPLNVMEVGAFGLGSDYAASIGASGRFNTNNSFFSWADDTGANVNTGGVGYMFGVNAAWGDSSVFQVASSLSNPTALVWRNTTTKSWNTIYSTGNTTKDSNGFIKGASPVIDVYNNKIGLNQDAEQQGSITFEKLGVGNYLVKGSLGFAQEGWYIEMPKDANGNVLVAVVYEQLENNDLSIKTYDYMLNKKGRIVPDTETPLDIPEGRFISLRLHELPKEMPVKSDDIQPEEVGLDK